MAKALVYEYNDFNDNLVITLSTQEVNEFSYDALTNTYVSADSQIILERHLEGTTDKTLYEEDGPARPKFLFTLDGYDYFGIIGGTVDIVHDFFANSENYSTI